VEGAMLDACFIEVIRLVVATPEAGSPANAGVSSSYMEFPASA